MFKNFDELEDNLTLHELEVLLVKARDVEREKQRFAASLKGINLGDDTQEKREEALARIAARVNARLAGVTEEEYEFSELGIQVIKE
jgi:hypothetical protein